MNATSLNAYLTKSAFKLALTCPTKLYYLLNNYPKSSDQSEYIKLLAEGGFIVGALAQLLYPSGQVAPHSGDPVIDFAETRKLITSGDIALFEATLLSGNKLALADILVKKNNVLKIIEVKSKSFDSSETGRDSANIFRNKKGEILSTWREYLLDVAFQVAILKECFSDFQIEPYLLLVDKAKRSELDDLLSYFTLERGEQSARPNVKLTKGITEPSKSTGLLTEIDVSREVAELSSFIEEEIALLEKTFIKKQKVQPVLSKTCRDCEFRGADLKPSGYNECWKDLGEPKHHIFDLYYGTTLKIDGRFLLDDLISQKKASLFDIPLELLKGKRGERQSVQILHTKKNQEWIDPKLFSFLSELKYPLHFIDFETTKTALPFHKGMRPFEQIAFQWSCHTVETYGAAPIHTEWINNEAVFPNFEFAKSLMKTLSKQGTVLTWASHEGSVLSDILEQAIQYNYADTELIEFLKLLVSSKGSQGRLVDMNRLTIDYYFHPEMGGKTSIKKVFPAIWRANPRIRKLAWFSDYEATEDGEIIDPYKKLPALMIDGIDITVREGTAAMRAYENMIFGEAAKDPIKKESWKKLLLQYCKLDTLAMVAIWEHWEELRRG